MKFFKNYRYKNLTLFLLSILLAIILSRFDLLGKILFNLGHLTLIGPIIAGILFVSTSTAALGILILFDLTKTISPFEIALIAGLGAMIGDLAFFRFFKGNLLSEITPIYNSLGGRHITKMLHHKYLSWTLPVIGAIIIASPLPDEVGVSLMGLTKIKSYQFMLLSLVLDITGIFLLISVYLSFK